MAHLIAVPPEAAEVHVDVMHQLEAVGLRVLQRCIRDVDLNRDKPN
jgi:hypothetical protein